MVSRRTNFGERSEPAPDRGGKLQSAGGAAQSNVSPLIRLEDGNIKRPSRLSLCLAGAILVTVILKGLPGRF